MPRHRHRVDSFSVTTAKHTHSKSATSTSVGDYIGGFREYFFHEGRSPISGTYTTGEGGGSNTGTASPYTSYVGSGTSFNNMPPYLVCNIWKRLS